jgi:two-component system, NtrC family, sensor kinase
MKKQTKKMAAAMTPWRNRWTRRLLAVSMLMAAGAVGGLAYWDSVREGEAALADFAQEQGTLSTALALALSARMNGDPTPTVPELLHGFKGVERPNSTAVLLLPPGSREFVRTDGGRVQLETLRLALQNGQDTARLSRAEAEALGLPARTAIAGLTNIAPSNHEAWGVAAVASAERDRDREARTQGRLVLSLFAAVSLVAGFGGLALRKQRNELSLHHELELQQMRETADDTLQKASRAATLGALAMGVAHEIATPLGVIAVRAEQIQAKLAGDERGTVAVGAILEQCDRINQIIRGLLGLARGGTPDAQRLEPREVLEGSVSLVAHRFAKAGVSLHRQVADKLPAVHGDLRLLEQALVNLLLNACDASPRGATVQVDVSLEKDFVVFGVQDQGSGILPEDADRVLQPFFTTKANGQGTGLGLAVAHEIVSSHRGRLALGPAQPRGTRAEMKIPVAEAIHA